MIWHICCYGCQAVLNTQGSHRELLELKETISRLHTSAGSSEPWLVIYAIIMIWHICCYGCQAVLNTQGSHRELLELKETISRLHTSAGSSSAGSSEPWLVIYAIIMIWHICCYGCQAELNTQGSHRELLKLQHKALKFNMDNGNRDEINNLETKSDKSVVCEEMHLNPCSNIV